jgi:hypothetical protein
MREILGKAQTVRELLKGVKYSIDYYQREYKWQAKQILELLDDLAGKFLEDYEEGHERKRVKDYPHYFLGSIIISKKDSASYVVDGQQRLTSLTLLLMLLRNLQREREVKVNIDECIFSEQFGEISFNIDVPDRLPCMEALYENRLDSFDPADRPESIQNLFQRYRDLEEGFPDELAGPALPYFIDWLLENVHLVEITAYSDDDAYTIFETMNDRGLSLSPTDMLKGYLLANMDETRRVPVNTLWRDRIRQLNDAGKEVEPDFFKSWLRSQHARKIRERKKNARPEDFDRIGTEFHRWVRDAAPQLGLTNQEAFHRFVQRDFDFYSRAYLRCIAASETLVSGLEPVFHNAYNGFTLQHMLLLAPLCCDDPEPVVTRKIWLVARYLDILLAWRLWNFRRIAYSTMQYAMFLVMREVRGLAAGELAGRLHAKLMEESETFTKTSDYHRPGVGFTVHQQNRYFVHGILARLTDHVERESGLGSRYLDYVRMDGRNRYEVEHVWANKAERHTDEFSHPSEFAEHRNRIGGLLLLPKSFNASYGDLPYGEKLPHYNSQNLLARSLHPQAYDHNPGFFQFLTRSGLPFKSHEQFKKADLDERSDLYCQLAQQVWNPDDLLEGGAA